LLDPEGFEPALSILRYEQFEVHLIQILDQQEIAPSSTGDLRLQELETGASLEVTADEALLAHYRAEVDRFLQQITTFCTERGIGYAQAFTSTPFEDLVLRVLRDGLILR
jgi:hypothetical protein